METKPEVPRDAGASAEGSSESPVTLAEWQRHIAAWSETKGWQFDITELPVKLLLIITEVVEAFEEYRNGKLPNELYYSADKQGNMKPEGIGIEIADAVIRILHMCETLHIDLQKLIEVKMAYNEKRPYRHGGKIV